MKITIAILILLISGCRSSTNSSWPSKGLTSVTISEDQLSEAIGIIKARHPESRISKLISIAPNGETKICYAYIPVDGSMAHYMILSSGIYLKIKNPNQALQPTVTTPVESGNEQGTSAEL